MARYIYHMHIVHFTLLCKTQGDTGSLAQPSLREKCVGSQLWLHVAGHIIDFHLW